MTEIWQCLAGDITLDFYIINAMMHMLASDREKRLGTSLLVKVYLRYMYNTTFYKIS